MLNVRIRTVTNENQNVYKPTVQKAVDSAKERPIQRNRNARVTTYAHCEAVLHRVALKKLSHFRYIYIYINI